ncbi:MAG: GWxTD domain-containing protein [Candidatus Cloacimonetes bacterium]|nr:GWxTD domain-containing protein [Candidatus Cloacimonadota bacterium]MCF7814380.1 GWxTD domain-containing protein [Candidatus Cloacimonadota bacterium]MCF7869003.1 GWxTD domain-containing protein [Candidatus Cloacimonadota bacterium]MCF7884397.1 GWxTD domain-containing protein [Candidatus Cloacimonadota bacterium]
MRRQAIVLLLILAASMQALNVFVDANRFQDENKNTILEINYQVPYKSLEFLKTPNGFEALLDVEFYLVKGDKIVYDYGFPNAIIVSNKQKTRSSDYFTDKISITLSKNFEVLVNFIDKNSEESSNWNYNFEVLPSKALLSDLEFSLDVSADTTSFLQKFHREGYLYRVIPSHIYNKTITDNYYIYWELYNPFSEEKDYTISKTLSYHDSLIFQETETLKLTSQRKIRLDKMALSDLEEGLYEYEIQVRSDTLTDLRQDFFSVKSYKISTQRLFVELEDEFKLISYFLTSEQTRSWPTLSKSGKLAFIERFWTTNNPDIDAEENSFFELVKERVLYCNQHFYHFEKGWSTDRGRVYIRHGQPDEIIRGNTGLNTKYTQKEYEIWKYRTTENLTYIFVDLQMSGNHKLIYSAGDEKENTYPNWDSYLGTDFDPTVLE